MSWETHRRRREVLLDTLHHAGRDPHGPLPYERVPGAAEVFTDQEDLLLALQHRWTLLLTGHIELAMLDADGDRVDAVSTAWRALASAEPVLRRVLDTHLGEHPAVEHEHRMLALWSGLAEPTESPDEVARIGKAFAALLRTKRTGRHGARPSGVGGTLTRS